MIFSGSVIESTTLPITLILSNTNYQLVIVVDSISFQLPITQLPISAHAQLQDLDDEAHGALVGQLLDGLFAVGAADAADHSQAVLELGALRAAATFGVEAVAIAGIVSFRINIGKDRKC